MPSTRVTRSQKNNKKVLQRNYQVKIEKKQKKLFYNYKVYIEAKKLEKIYQKLLKILKHTKKKNTKKVLDLNITKH